MNEIKIDVNVYNFTFAGSSGGVKEYLVTIEGVLDSNKTTTTWISDVPLTPAQVYEYTIVAVNGIDEKSDSFTGSLLVGAESKYIYIIYIIILVPSFSPSLHPTSPSFPRNDYS